MRIAYVGNFEPAYSTENDILRTLRDELDIKADPVQEQHTANWIELTGRLDDYDAVLWTSTRGLASQVPDVVQLELLYRAALLSVPTIGVHLDRWWGLARWGTVLTAPFFRCAHVFTADGFHDRHFEAAGVNHHWSLPAIADHNAVPGTPRPDYTSDIAFVGSWQGRYHREWQHRDDLVRFLRSAYGRRVTFWPPPGEPAVRGPDLADLYASVRLVVGDSCLAPSADGAPMENYCSDRIPETLGRRGLLLHPHVAGVTDGPFVAGQHLLCWEPGDWNGLRAIIDLTLGDPVAADAIRHAGYEHVRERHTYARRLDAILRTVQL